MVKAGNHLVYSETWFDHSNLNKLTHVASLQFLPSGQYGLCFGYCFSGPLPLCSHNRQITGYACYGACLRESLVIRSYSEIGQIHILALKLSVAQPVYLWVTATVTVMLIHVHNGVCLFVCVCDRPDHRRSVQTSIVQSSRVLLCLPQTCNCSLNIYKMYNTLVAVENSGKRGMSPAYEPCSGPMVQHYWHGATIFTHPIAVRTFFVPCRTKCGRGSI